MMNNVQSRAFRNRLIWRSLIAVLALGAIGVEVWLIQQQLAEARRPARQSPPPRPAFDTSQSTIPVEHIKHGGPGKDGIPALSNAQFVPAAEALFMAPEDRVIGVVIGGASKAYPLKTLDRHEAVNDDLAGDFFTVTYCPLCDSSAVFNRRSGDQTLTFGISGLLYNSNVLLYDRGQLGRESLWSQMASSAVTGPKIGQTLQKLPLEVTSWEDWSLRHPDTLVLVLSDKAGQRRTYEQRAYRSYFAGPSLMFPVEPIDKRLALKAPVLGVASKRVQKAYPLDQLRKVAGGKLVDAVDGRQLTLIYSSEHDSVRVEQADAGLEWMYSFWFAWAAFHPETTIYEP